MASGSQELAVTTIPCLRYRDVRAAIQWLHDAFGFEPHLIVEDGNGNIRHAQLRLGCGLVILGPVTEHSSAFGRLMRGPREVGGVTQAVYLVVSDADAVYRRVREMGAEIVVEVHDEDYGGRGFGCRDPEGHLWYVGTYDPWLEPTTKHNS